MHEKKVGVYRLKDCINNTVVFLAFVSTEIFGKKFESTFLMLQRVSRKPNGGSILGSSQFTLLPQLPLKTILI